VSSSEIKKIGVVGAGTMGNGIAHVFSQSGFDVVLVETTTELVERGLEGGYRFRKGKDY